MRFRGFRVGAGREAARQGRREPREEGGRRRRGRSVAPAVGRQRGRGGEAKVDDAPDVGKGEAVVICMVRFNLDVLSLCFAFFVVTFCYSNEILKSSPDGFTWTVPMPASGGLSSIEDAAAQLLVAAFLHVMQPARR